MQPVVIFNHLHAGHQGAVQCGAIRQETSLTVAYDPANERPREVASNNAAPCSSLSRKARESLIPDELRPINAEDQSPTRLAENFIHAKSPYCIRIGAE
jgi:hypothetical protein